MFGLLISDFKARKTCFFAFGVTFKTKRKVSEEVRSNKLAPKAHAFGALVVPNHLDADLELIFCKVDKP